MKEKSTHNGGAQSISGDLESGVNRATLHKMDNPDHKVGVFSRVRPDPPVKWSMRLRMKPARAACVRCTHSHTHKHTYTYTVGARDEG